MKICFLTPRFPYPPHKGDALRVYHQLRVLSRDHHITLLSMTDGPIDPAHLAEVQSLCDTVEIVNLPKAQVLWNLGTGLFSSQPLQVHYYHSGAFQSRLDEILAREKFDAVHVTLMRLLPYVENLQGPDAPKVVVDLVDSLTLNLEGRRSQIKGPMRWAYELEYGRVKAYEQNVVSRQPNLVVSSPADQKIFGDHVTVIPNGVDVDKFPFQSAAGRTGETLVFTGNMGYQPNEEAVLWFVQEVLPRLQAVRPGVKFQIVGTQPEKVKALARDFVGVEVTGPVPEVLPYLQKAAAAVTPMRSGSGIQNKVLEAMSAGAPVISTAIANRGVNGVNGRDLVLADTAETFAEAVLKVLETPALRQSLARAGREYVEQRFRWEAHARMLAELYGAPKLDHSVARDLRAAALPLPPTPGSTLNLN